MSFLETLAKLFFTLVLLTVLAFTCNAAWMYYDGGAVWRTSIPTLMAMSIIPLAVIIGCVIGIWFCWRGNK